jgi:glucose-1-phosphate adenylyltransferase
MSAPIFSRPRYLPGSKINGAQIDHAVISDGCIINRARINQSIVGLRTIIGDGTELNRVVILGSDFYESAESVERHESEGAPRVGIGAHCKIENAIIDKNARIGNNVTISPAGKPENVDHERYFVRDGIVIIPKDAVIPHGTVI